MTDEFEKERHRLRRKNKYAKNLSSSLYRQRKVPSGKEYRRENKGNLRHKILEEDDI